MNRALEGIKIVDLSHVLAAPYCTMILADLGADVVKVEPPQGDDSRSFGPFLGKADGAGEAEAQSGYFISINRNKRSVCIDLKQEKGRRILRTMIAGADVVVENYRPGTMSRLGFSYEEMKAVKPDIIYCSICGFGHDALPEYSSRPAYDMVAQGFSGLMSITGPEGGPPVRVGSSIGDIAAGHQGAVGILAALRFRDKEGAGQHIDIAMVDSLVSILENAVVRYTIEHQIPAPLGTAHPAITPFQAFETLDGSWIIIPIGNDSLWRTFCQAIERTDLADHELFRTNPLRTANRNRLIPILELELKKRPREEWFAIMERLGLPCAPISTIDAVVEDPNLRYRKMFVEIDQPRAGRITITGSPYRMSATPGAVYRHAPLLGEHTVEYLQGELGMTPEETAELLAEKVVFTS